MTVRREPHPLGSAVESDSRRESTSVLFINTTVFFGPVMQVHRQVMKNLDPTSHRVLCVTNSKGDSDHEMSKLKDVETKKYYLGDTFREKSGFFGMATRAFQNFPSFISFIQILWLVRRRNVEIIHSASAPRMLLLGVMLSMFSRAKLVTHVHEEHVAGRSLRARAVAWGLRRSEAVITVSKFIADSVIKLDVEPSRVWPILNVVDIKKYHPGVDGSEIRREFGIPEDVPLIVAVGRVIPEKGQKFLVEAMKAVVEVAPNTKALIVGWDGEVKMPSGLTYLQELKEFVERNKLDDTVIFAGPRTDIPKVFAASDIVVIPSSYDDPCPLVVLEAMASGKPVIGTRSGGVPEMLADDSGIVVPKDSADDIGEALLALLADPDFRQQMALKARRRVEEKFYEARFGSEVQQVYQSVLE